MLLQKVNSESEKPGSGILLKVGLYILSLIVAFMFGYYEHSPSHSAAPAPVAVNTPPPAPAPTSAGEEASSVPLAASTPEVEPTISPLSPSASSTPMRIERGTAVSHSTPTPAAAPAKTANEVTVTEPVEIPVKDDTGKITGYINLQKGQLITPAGVENDQIKVKIGKNFVMVPISSTDMPH